MKLTPRSAADAQRVSRRQLLRAGWYEASIADALEKLSARGNPTIELTVLIRDADGNDRIFRDWLTDSGLGAAKLRHACESVGALARYEAGEIEAADFTDKTVRVKIGVERKRSWPDRNIIEDYGSAAVAPAMPMRRIAGAS